MKIVIGLLVLLAIANVFLALRRNKLDAEHVLDKSEKRTRNQALRTMQQVERLSQTVERFEKKGLVETKAHKQLERVSDRLDLMTVSSPTSMDGGSSGSGSGGGNPGPLKRF